MDAFAPPGRRVGMPVIERLLGWFRRVEQDDRPWHSLERAIALVELQKAIAGRGGEADEEGLWTLLLLTLRAYSLAVDETPHRTSSWRRSGGSSRLTTSGAG